LRFDSCWTVPRYTGLADLLLEKLAKVVVAGPMPLCLSRFRRSLRRGRRRVGRGGKGGTRIWTWTREMQCFRACIYVREGRVKEGQLSPDGQHQTEADDESWDFLLFDEKSR